MEVENINAVIRDILTVEVKSQDEFGELAASFSEMISILKVYIQDLANVFGNIEKGNLDVVTNKNYQANFIEMKNSMLKDFKLKIYR